ncbi:hypothetical protein BSM4216_3522 [Bacillus smithii]|nr:hypothetical protein BSM4216_3522 [Bacillus smithii]
MFANIWSEKCENGWLLSAIVVLNRMIIQQGVSFDTGCP